MGAGTSRTRKLFLAAEHVPDRPALGNEMISMAHWDQDTETERGTAGDNQERLHSLWDGTVSRNEGKARAGPIRKQKDRGEPNSAGASPAGAHQSGQKAEERESPWRPRSDRARRERGYVGLVIESMEGWT